MNSRFPVRGLWKAAAIAASLAALVACATIPPATSSTGGALSAQAERLILVTVANPGGPILTEAGSTPRGYQRLGPYAAGDQARATAAALARDYGLHAIREWPIAPLKVHCLVFSLPPQANRAVLLSRLGADRRVQLAQPLQLFSALNGQAPAIDDGVRGDDARAPGSSSQARAAPSYNDPYFALQRGFAAINAGAAQQWSRGEGVSVALIDTGVAVQHPDLAGRIATVRNFVDDDRRGFESDRHGTAVAGIIGAVANNKLGIVGVAPAANLQIYKACQPLQPHSLEAQCNSFTLALALSAAIEAHAQIVNLSLGGPADPLLTQLVDQGVHRGMIFVGAVPADGSLSGFPLGITGVIAVDDSRHSDASNTVLYAPGREILSLAPDGHYDFATGSSFAAAHVTGAIALLRSRAPRLDAAALFAVFARTQVHDDDGDAIDICAALAAAQPLDDCTHASRALAATTATH